MSVYRILVALLGVCAISTTAEAGKATPLFDGEEIIEIRIEAPIRDLARAAPRSTDPYPATLVLLGADSESHPIELSARGKSRRDKNVCQFPPLRVEFLEKPDETSLFHKQKRLKLVTHCRSGKSYQQYYLLEFAAYRLLNLLTPASFRVRLAQVSYFDTEKGKETTSRTGFFIEDVDDLAKRVDMKEVELPSLELSQVDRSAAARLALFQYMIGNLDWALLDGPEDDDCCHNGKVIGADQTALSGLIVTPYDFDYSGLVGAPYAVPPDSIKVKSVKTRVYRGFCAHNDELLTAVETFKANRSGLEGTLAATPGLATRTRDKALRYLGQFFDDIANDDKVARNITNRCRD